MDTNSVRDFLLSPTGLSLVLFSRAFIAAVLICGGIQLFGFKNLTSFFTWKRVVGLFLLILGIRILISVLFFFSIS